LRQWPQRMSFMGCKVLAKSGSLRPACTGGAALANLAGILCEGGGDAGATNT